MVSPAVGALTGIVPVAVAGGVALAVTDRALGQRGKAAAPPRRTRVLSKSEKLEIVKAAFRLRLTTAQARNFTKQTGRKLPTLTQAKKVMGQVQRLQQRPMGGGLKRRRGL